MQSKKQSLIIEDSNSLLDFSPTSSETEPVWSRYITYDNEQLFHLGNTCGTCHFLFHRLEKTLNKSIIPEGLVEKLNQGLTEIDNDLIHDYSQLLPNDKYEVILFEVSPKLIFPDSENDYFINDLWKTWENRTGENKSEVNIEYYRGVDKAIKQDEKIYEFFIPLYPTSQLNEERVKYYEDKILSGEKPTAVSIALLDVKCPIFYPEIDGKEVKPDFFTHWCFANYMIDGHHKMQAAARQNKSITMLTFLARRLSWQLIDEMLTYY